MAQQCPEHGCAKNIVLGVATRQRKGLHEKMGQQAHGPRDNRDVLLNQRSRGLENQSSFRSQRI